MTFTGNISMAKVTDENDNLVEVTVLVPVSDLNRIFDLAVKIDQINVEYQSDPLKMANEAIKLMQAHASEIAALSGYHG